MASKNLWEDETSNCSNLWSISSQNEVGDVYKKLSYFVNVWHCQVLSVITLQEMALESLMKSAGF